MPKRIMWTKGMRLTEEILNLSDKCILDVIAKGLTLGASGRMGLLPSQNRRFSLTVDINDQIIDVNSIDCIGLTSNGTLIDVQYDTNYSNSFDTRVALPSQNTEVRYYLCIAALDQWRDTNDGMCEPLYSYLIVEENSPIPGNALPIARVLFDQYCWRIDESDFVPPCLFVKSHSKFEELAHRFLDVLRNLEASLPEKLMPDHKEAAIVFWPNVQRLLIEMDKEQDTMSPMELLANIQKLVSSFYCACSLDENINFSNPEPYVSYIRTPYNYKNAYQIVCKGIDLSLEINDKLDLISSHPVKAEEPMSIAAPTIDKTHLTQVVKFGSAKFKVKNNEPGSIIYYTTDGSNPNQASKSGTTVVVETGFTDDWHKEPPINLVIKIVAFKDGIFSNIETYNARVLKGNPFIGKEI